MNIQQSEAAYGRAIRICSACIFVVAFAIAGIAQECPKDNATGPTIPSEARTLEGRLIYHDGIRKWFELKLDQPQCGEESVQVVPAEEDWTPIEVRRGCRVRARGTLDFATTGYYSLAVYQTVDQIEPVGACAPQSLLPNYSKTKPERSVRKYRVDMQVNYRPGDHPIIFNVSSAGKKLTPWQAYADYSLTGGFVLYGRCADGFVVDKVFGTPEANPSHADEPRTSDDMAMFDPETAVDSGKKDLHLGYTCVR